MNDMPRIEARLDENTCGQFIVEPLGQGLGNTLGNALRRMLLSGIQGAAVTSICIHKKNPSEKDCPYIEHEFKTIPGVKEDVTDFMLNLRNLYVKMDDSIESGNIYIKAKGSGDITGERIICDEGIEVVNKDVYLAYVTDEDADFSVTMTVEKGKGFLLPEKQINVPKQIGIIPMASVFSPILKVAYNVEPCRVGQNTNFERLVLDIETNGTIKAGDALKNACMQLIEMFTLIGSYAGDMDFMVSKLQREDVSDAKELGRSVETLQFSHRTANCLRKEEIKTVGELISFSENELLKIKSFGKISLDEVKLKLEELGLNLKD
ncbi:MAG: DNA-directed RNA polymerase subunit alpha [Armatimonadetes bacterium]|nr:DNA-directed RNA polymerase subunit alpha [Candidatus Hippobium faecium]